MTATGAPSGRRRVAVLTSHPVQYQAPFFRTLAAREEVDLTVLYCSDVGVSDRRPPVEAFGRTLVWDVDLLSGYRHRFLAGLPNAHPERRWSLVNVGIVGELRRERYAAVVSMGWAYPVQWLCFAAARWLGTPLILYSDTDVRDAGTIRARFPGRWAMRSLVKSAAAALYTGTFNRDFYIRHGMDPERLFFSPWAVDATHFEGHDRDDARRRLGLKADTVYFLFVGTLIERKRPLAVVRAIRQLRERGLAVGAIFAGSGPLEHELRGAAADELEDVHLLGFQNQTALPSIYAAADALVLPSWRDPRATVVNEAMASGLPVIVSTGTGVWGPGDLVRDGREGLVVPAGDDDALARACQALVDPETRLAMSVAARARSAVWSHDAAAEGWVDAIYSLPATTSTVS